MTVADSRSGVVTVWLGAGAFVAFAAAAAEAGWWLLVALLLAGVLTVCTWRTTAVALSIVEQNSMWRWVIGVRVAARLGALALFGAVFGAYVAPTHADLAAAVVPLVAVVAHLLGARMNAYWRRWVIGLLLLAAAGLLALCVAIVPAESTALDAGPEASGLLPAVAVLFPLFTGVSQVTRRRALLVLAGALGVALVVAAAALYQLGPLRLGLAPTSMRDLLAAADARALEPALAAVVALATISASLAALDSTVDELDRAGPGAPRALPVLACGVVAALLGFLVPVVSVLLVAAIAALAEALVLGLVVVTRKRTPVAAVCVLCTVVLLASTPQSSMLIAAGLHVVAVLGYGYLSRTEPATRTG